MSQKYLIRITELERLLSEQAEAFRQKDQQLSLGEETETFQLFCADFTQIIPLTSTFRVKAFCRLQTFYFTGKMRR
ncbi:transposase [Escherichia coli]|nr:transposase [Escherichia coli]CAD5753027.1 transposase [Escherichia coli]